MALCDQFQINGLIALEQHTFSHAGQPSRIYRDPAYPLQVHLQAPQTHAVMTPHMQEFNTFTSAVRTSVKWHLGDINYEKCFKTGLYHFGKMYIVCPILQNALTCLYQNQTSYFNLEPPTLQEYFS